MERKQFGSRFSYDMMMATYRAAIIPACLLVVTSSPRRSKVMRNQILLTSGHISQFTHGGDENVLKRGKRTLEELNHPSSISLLYIQEKSEESEKYGNKAFFSFFCESLSLEELGDAKDLNRKATLHVLQY